MLILNPYFLDYQLIIFPLFPLLCQVLILHFISFFPRFVFCFSYSLYFAFFILIINYLNLFYYGSY